MLNIGKKAIDFTAAAVMNNGEINKNFNLYNFINNKYALLFFYPMDFTFVCPSELIALNKRFAEFQKKDVQIYIYIS